MIKKIDPSDPRLLNLITEPAQPKAGAWEVYLQDLLASGWPGRDFDPVRLVLRLDALDHRNTAQGSLCARRDCHRLAKTDGLCRRCSNEFSMTSLIHEAFVTTPSAERFQCPVPECEREHHSQGLCVSHRNRWRAAGEPPDVHAWASSQTLVGERLVTACLVKGCARDHHALGLCAGHHSRWKRAHRPAEPAKWASTQSQISQVEQHAGCLVAGCDGNHSSRGLCQAHEKRWRAAGTPEEIEVWASTQSLVKHVDKTFGCLVPGCEREHQAHSLCAQHSQRWRRSGRLNDVDTWAASQTPFERVHGGPGCLIDACERDHKAKDLCSLHYERWSRAGRPVHLEAWASTQCVTSDGKTRGCLVTGCDRVHYARGLCGSHVGRWVHARRPEDVRAWASEQTPIAQPKRRLGCMVEDCDEIHASCGLCSRHYGRWRDSGRPDPVETWADSQHTCVVPNCLAIRPAEQSLCEKHAGLCRTWAAHLGRDGLPWWEQVAEWLQGGDHTPLTRTRVVPFGVLPAPLSLELAAAALHEDTHGHVKLDPDKWRAVIRECFAAGVSSAVGLEELPAPTYARAVGARAARWITQSHPDWSKTSADRDVIHLSGLRYNKSTPVGDGAKIDLTRVLAYELRGPLRGWVVDSHHNAGCGDVYAAIAVIAIAAQVLGQAPPKTWSHQHMTSIVEQVRQRWTTQISQRSHLLALDKVLTHARRSAAKVSTSQQVEQWVKDWRQVPVDFHRHAQDPDHQPLGTPPGGKQADESFRYVPAPVMNHLIDHLHLLRMPTSWGVRRRVGRKFNSLEHRVLLFVSYACGRRPRETVQLKRNCVKHDSAGDPYLEWQRAKNPENSTPRPRRLPIGREVVTAIEQWLEYLDDQGVTGQWLFPNMNDERSDTHLRSWSVNDALKGRNGPGLLEMLPKLPGAVESSTGEWVHFDLDTIDAYSFRHAFAQRAADAYVLDASGHRREVVPSAVLQEWMDHKTYQTTMHYYNVSAKRQRAALATMPATKIFDIHGHQHDPPADERVDYLRAKAGPNGGMCTEPAFVAGQRCPTGEDCELCPMWRVAPAERGYILMRQRDLRIRFEKSKALRAPRAKIDCLKAGIEHCQIMLDAIDRFVAGLDREQQLAIKDTEAAQTRLEDQYRLTTVNLQDWIPKEAAK